MGFGGFSCLLKRNRDSLIFLSNILFYFILFLSIGGWIHEEAPREVLFV